MPLSIFDGEPSEELHEHYDADGNLTGSTLVTRPGWADMDRAWALGLALREAGTCPGCGGDLAETLDPDWKWIPEDPAECFRCGAIHASQKAFEKDQRARSLLHGAKKVARKKPKKKAR